MTTYGERQRAAGRRMAKAIAKAKAAQTPQERSQVEEKLARLFGKKEQFNECPPFVFCTYCTHTKAVHDERGHCAYCGNCKECV